MNWLILQEEW